MGSLPKPTCNVNLPTVEVVAQIARHMLRLTRVTLPTRLTSQAPDLSAETNSVHLPSHSHSVRSRWTLTTFVVAVLSFVGGPSDARAQADVGVDQGADAGSYPFFNMQSQPALSEGGRVRPNLFTGAATYSLPIVIPPGINGTVPRLELSYSSRRRSWNAGKGWSFGLPFIARSTDYGSDVAYNWADAEAKYVFAGEELVAAGIEADPFGCSARRYYERASSVRRILFCLDGSHRYWTVTDRDGTFATFGKYSEARFLVDWRTFVLLLATAACLVLWQWWRRRLRAGGLQQAMGAIVAVGIAGSVNGTSAANSVLAIDGKAFEYYLDSVRDPNGLEWRAEYSRYGDSDMDGVIESVDLVGAAPLLTRIRYTYRGDEVAGGTEAVREVNVTWEPRPDGKPEYVSFEYGIPLTSARRLQTITVRVGEAVVRSYHLSYDADRHTDNEQYTADSDASALARVAVTGADTATFGPPIEFEYTTNAGSAIHGFAALALERSKPPTQASGLGLQQWWSGFGTPSSFSEFTTSGLYDINGDGFFDFVKSDYVWPNCDCRDWALYLGYDGLDGGGNILSSAVRWPGTPSGPEDVNSLRISDRASTQVRVGSISDDTWESLSDAYQTRHEIVDVNSDGLPDYLQSNGPQRDSWAVRLNTGTSLSSESPWIFSFLEPGEHRPVNDFIRAYHKPSARSTWKVADLVDANGDGCPDRLEVRGNEWFFAPSRICRDTSVYGKPLPAFGRFVRWSWSQPLPYLELSTIEELGHWQETRTRTFTQLADLNGDGLVDLFDHDLGGSKTRVLLGNGRGFVVEAGLTTYGADLEAIFGSQPHLMRQYSNGTLAEGPDIQGQEVGLVDLNGDRLRDLVIADGNPYYTAYLNTGRGF